MIKDATGRKLKIGSIVEILLVGMFKGKVVGIKENAIHLSGNQAIHPHVAVQVVLTPFINPQNESVADVYITAEPDPKDPLVMEEKESSHLIKPS